MTASSRKIVVIISAMSALSACFHISEGRAEQGFHSYSGVKIQDKETRLEWAVDAGTPSFKSCSGGKKMWQDASDYVTCLNSNKYLGHSDWRLPSTKEITRLVSKIANHKYGIAGTKLKEQGFKNLQPSLYWSSNLLTDEVALAVEVIMNGESSHPVGTSNTLYVLPVRGGNKVSKK